MEGGSSSRWRHSILYQIQKRNKEELIPFQGIITTHNKVFEIYNAARVENLQLTIQNEKLRRKANYERPPGNGNISILEGKLLSQQEELTELHKKRGENAQAIIDLNTKLQETEAKLLANEESLAKQKMTIARLQLENERYQQSKKELENLNQHIRDEHTALQLTYYHLEEKLRKAQEENVKLLDQLIKFKNREAEKMNEDAENFMRVRNLMLQKELEDAAKDMRGVNLESLPEDGAVMQRSQVPTSASIVIGEELYWPGIIRKTRNTMTRDKQSF